MGATPKLICIIYFVPLSCYLLPVWKGTSGGSPSDLNAPPRHTWSCQQWRRWQTIPRQSQRPITLAGSRFCGGVSKKDDKTSRPFRPVPRVKVGLDERCAVRLIFPTNAQVTTIIDPKNQHGGWDVTFSGHRFQRGFPPLMCVCTAGRNERRYKTRNKNVKRIP